MSEVVLVKPVITAINIYLQLQDGNAYLFIYPAKSPFHCFLTNSQRHLLHVGFGRRLFSR